jgi:hypothetical protein
MLPPEKVPINTQVQSWQAGSAPPTWMAVRDRWLRTVAACRRRDTAQHCPQLQRQPGDDFAAGGVSVVVNRNQLMASGIGVDK